MTLTSLTGNSFCAPDEKRTVTVRASGSLLMMLASSCCPLRVGALCSAERHAPPLVIRERAWRTEITGLRRPPARAREPRRTWQGTAQQGRPRAARHRPAALRGRLVKKPSDVIYLDYSDQDTPIRHPIQPLFGRLHATSLLLLLRPQLHPRVALGGALFGRVG